MKDYIVADWLNEEDAMGAMPPPAGQPDPNAAPVDSTQQGGPPPNPQNDPNAANQDNANQPTDVNQDPPVPDMPDEKPKVDDFESWKKQFERECVKGDTQKLIDLLSMVRDKEGLHPSQTKYIEDNWNIQLLKMNANIEKASKDIRRNIKEQLDRNNPGTTIVSHLTAVLQTVPTLNNIFIKLRNCGPSKGDWHRKFIAALTGSIQVGNYMNKADIVFNERDYSISMSTRCNSEWGEVMLGEWSMKEDSPDCLSDAEKKRLENGSPEEKDVLKRRIILESIAAQYETRSFIINVIDEDGMVYTLGWDISNSLRGAYTEGKIVVKTKTSDTSEAIITEDGNIVPVLGLDIYYTKETGEQNDNGMPEVEEIPFIEKRNGTLFLVADLKTIKDAANSLQGIILKETPYNGNPSDLKVISRCIYSTHDILLRQC